MVSVGPSQPWRPPPTISQPQMACVCGHFAFASPQKPEEESGEELPPVPMRRWLEVME